MFWLSRHWVCRLRRTTCQVRFRLEATRPRFVELLASRTQELGEAIAASDQLRQDHDALAAKHEQLQQDYTALKQSLDTTEDHSQQRRPEASGATGEQLAQF